MVERNRGPSAQTERVHRERVGADRAAPEGVTVRLSLLACYPRSLSRPRLRWQRQALTGPGASRIEGGNQSRQL
jgi:hypothetical protein